MYGYRAGGCCGTNTQGVGNYPAYVCGGYGGWGTGAGIIAIAILILIALGVIFNWD